MRVIRTSLHCEACENGNGNGNGREWEYRKSFPIISTAEVVKQNKCLYVSKWNHRGISRFFCDSTMSFWQCIFTAQPYSPARDWIIGVRMSMRNLSLRRWRSVFECCPLVVLQWLALGLPCVSNDWLLDDAVVLSAARSFFLHKFLIWTCHLCRRGHGGDFSFTIAHQRINLKQKHWETAQTKMPNDIMLSQEKIAISRDVFI